MLNINLPSFGMSRKAVAVNKGTWFQKKRSYTIKESILQVRWPHLTIMLLSLPSAVCPVLKRLGNWIEVVSGVLNLRSNCFVIYFLASA